MRRVHVIHKEGMRQQTRFFFLSELNVQPVILNIEDIDDAGQNGRRILLISWKVNKRYF